MLNNNIELLFNIANLAKLSIYKALNGDDLMNEDKPLVSIIVPSYNHEEFVGECIESIIKQDYKNIELIILNDGSKDNTANIIRSYESACKERFNRFIFIDKENEGICKTLNRGIKESTGEYYCFMASDDFMLENCISEQINYFNDKKSVERVFCNFYRYLYDINKKELNYKKDPKWTKYMNSKREKFYIENLLGNQLAVFGMYKKSVIDKVGLFDEKLLFEDWDISLRILNSNIKLGYISKPIYCYRRHSSNISGNGNYKFILEGSLQVINKIEKDNTIELKNKAKIIRRAKSNKYISFAYILKESNNEEYKIYLKKAIELDPFNIHILKFRIKSILGIH